jgi:hypothetical protein
MGAGRSASHAGRSRWPGWSVRSPCCRSWRRGYRRRSRCRATSAVPAPATLGRSSGRRSSPAGSRSRPGRRIGLAAPIASFLRSLHSIDPDDHRVTARLPLDANRRADMPYRVDFTHRRFAELRELDVWDVPHDLAELIESARHLPAPAAPRLTHGDLHLRHILIDRGRLSGVIDWVDVGRADPAIDLPLYWGFVPPTALLMRRSCGGHGCWPCPCGARSRSTAGGRGLRSSSERPSTACRAPWMADERSGGICDHADSGRVRAPLPRPRSN